MRLVWFLVGDQPNHLWCSSHSSFYVVFLDWTTLLSPEKPSLMLSVQWNDSSQIGCDFKALVLRTFWETLSLICHWTKLLLFRSSNILVKEASTCFTWLLINCQESKLFDTLHNIRNSVSMKHFFPLNTLILIIPNAKYQRFQPATTRWLVSQGLCCYLVFHRPLWFRSFAVK